MAGNKGHNQSAHVPGTLDGAAPLTAQAFHCEASSSVGTGAHASVIDEDSTWIQAGAAVNPESV